MDTPLEKENAMQLYLVHGTSRDGRTHFCGLPVRATGKAHAMKKVRAEGLAPRGIRQVSRMPELYSIASPEYSAIAERLVAR